MTWIKVILAVCFFNLAPCDADAIALDGMLSNAMQQMLNIEPPRSKRQAISPPLYMMDLYKKYLSSDSMKTRSNTIRSIVPVRAQIDGEDMLLFNLSALSVSEDISSAELHFYKRRHSGDRGRSDKKQNQHNQLQRRRHWWQLQHLQGYLVAEHKQQIGKWEVEVDRRGWMVYDVTKMVDQWERNHNREHQIGFLFQGVQRSSGLYNSLSLDSVVRMDPSPFLIVFSNERSNASLEQAAGLKKTPSLNALPDSGASVRSRRSVTDNELPEMNHFNQNNVIPQSNPAGILKVRNSGRKSHHHSQKTTEVPPPFPSKVLKRPAGTVASYADINTEETENAEWPTKTSTLPYPKNRSRISEDKRKRSRKGKRRNRKLPENWHYNQQHANDARLELPEDAGKSLCQRRKLSVDFNEIGWGEWIISPKTFDAQYCAGRCPFPLTKGLNPTNHATIQSIVHAIGGYPEVPAPCCVPDVLSSLTLLYFDDNRNVVLKNYPSMTAESCACR